MNSRITIDFTDEFKPVIRVKESQDSEDVRDKLLRSFREQLSHQSNTLFLEFLDYDKDDSKPLADNSLNYVIHPVGDELEYFKVTIIRMYSAVLKREEDIKKIEDFFAWVRSEYCRQTPSY